MIYIILVYFYLINIMLFNKSEYLIYKANVSINLLKPYDSFDQFFLIICQDSGYWLLFSLVNFKIKRIALIIDNS